MPTTDPDRQRRLAQQLRANLRRRKAHGRDQAAGDTPAPRAREDDPPPPDRPG